VATAAPQKPEEQNKELTLASLYAADLICNTLLQAGTSLRTIDIARSIALPEFDAKLARVILITHRDRFTLDPTQNNQRVAPRERRWTLWLRYMDTSHSFDRNLQRILLECGRPLRIEILAREMSAIYHRPQEVYDDIIRRYVIDGKRYFHVENTAIAPTGWLLETEASLEAIYSKIQQEREEEILFDNFLTPEEVYRYLPLAEELELTTNPTEKIPVFLDRVDEPVHGKVLQFLAYHLDPEGFDARKFYTAIYRSGAFPLQGNLWIGAKTEARLRALFPLLAEQEVGDEAELQKEQEILPLELTDEDREALVQKVLQTDGTTFANQLLEEHFEISPSYPTYKQDLDTITEALKEDSRVLWVGSLRFRPQGSLPPYVYTVPSILHYPQETYFDADGNPIDVLLEDEGFDGNLRQEILNPLAQDVLDEEEPLPEPDPNPPTTARAVIKYHHKQIGTMPLCQFPPGFFPPKPTILETEFVLPGGQTAQVWVNNETRLLYGLFDWFSTIPIDSGATFTLERQAPDRYVVNYNDESEPIMFISRNRINELLELQQRAETEQLPNFEILRHIMEHYRKGIEYLTLLTEANVVRRMKRRMVASILSGYHCFFQRGGVWVFDARKLSQGFDRSKRKYIIH